MGSPTAGSAIARMQNLIEGDKDVPKPSESRARCKKVARGQVGLPQSPAAGCSKRLKRQCRATQQPGWVSGPCAARLHRRTSALTPQPFNRMHHADFGHCYLKSLADWMWSETDFSLVAGNAEVALGDLTAAQRHFHQAAADPGLESIAYANLALVTFESGQDEEAIKAARQLLRRYAVSLVLQGIAAVVVVCRFSRSDTDPWYLYLQGCLISGHALRPRR